MTISLIFFELKAGGGVIQCFQLARHLQAKGYTIRLFCYQNLIPKDLEILAKDIEIICVVSGKKSTIERFGLLRKIWRLAKITSSYPCDLINPHEWPANMVGVLVKIKTGKPVVWMCNDLWHVPEQYLSLQGDTLQGISRQVRFLLDMYLTGFVDSVVVLDHRIQALIKKYYHKDSLVIRSGFDSELFQKPIPKKTAREKLNLPQDDFIFLCFGVMYPHRRFEDAIEGLHILKKNKYDAKLIIVGDSSYSPEYYKNLQKIIKRKGLDQDVIIRSEHVSFEKQLAYYSSCDAFIFPNDQQTWGITPIELMSLGTPCIVSKGAGVHEVLTDKKNALLFESKNINELVGCMKLVLINKSLAKTIGSNAQKFVRSRFSWERYTNDMEKIFKSTLNKTDKS